uniref:Uncharacterized protein n=1 Tax=Oryza sativa subsp. japonica TaxID=39947 RepID=Q8S7B9_ORYSJ|nr:Hypothetical protein [Oryza sativa Japonica Group]
MWVTERLRALLSRSGRLWGVKWRWATRLGEVEGELGDPTSSPRVEQVVLSVSLSLPAVLLSVGRVERWRRRWTGRGQAREAARWAQKSMSRDELVPITRVHEEAPLTETSIAVDAIITRNLEDAARDDAILPTTDGGAFVVDLHLREEPGGRSGGLAGGDEVVVAVSQPGRLRWRRLRQGGHLAQVLEEEGVAAGGHRGVVHAQGGPGVADVALVSHHVPF